MKKPLILIILTITLHFPFSCDFNDYPTYRYEVNGIEITTGSLFQYQFTPYDPTDTDSIPASYFAFRLLITDFSSKKVSLNNGAVNVCFAEPAPPGLTIESMSISSSQTIVAKGLTYEAGSNLADLFQSVTYWDLYSPLYITLISPIDQPLNQKFLISITLDSNQTFNLETENVIVKP